MVTAYRSRLLAMAQPTITPRRRSRFEPRPGTGGTPDLEVPRFDDSPLSARAGVAAEGLENEESANGVMPDSGVGFKSNPPRHPGGHERAADSWRPADRSGTRSPTDTAAGNTTAGGTTVGWTVVADTGTSPGPGPILERGAPSTGARLVEARNVGESSGFDGFRDEGVGAGDTERASNGVSDGTAEQPGGSVAPLLVSALPEQAHPEQALSEPETNDPPGGRAAAQPLAEAPVRTNRTIPGQESMRSDTEDRIRPRDAHLQSEAANSVGRTAASAAVTARAAVSGDARHNASTAADVVVMQPPTDSTDPGWNRTLIAVRAATSFGVQLGRRGEPTDAARTATDARRGATEDAWPAPARSPRPMAGSLQAIPPSTPTTAGPIEVTVRIGRVDVHPNAAPPPRRPAAAAQRATTSLEDYLQARTSGRVG